MTDAGKLQAAAKKRNVIVVANMTMMAFTTDGTMALVYKLKTREWPNGLAYST
jgi:hypothetical protein